MKQIIFCVLFLAFFAASATVASAQKKQMYFGKGDQGGDACVEALQNGTASFYRPTDFSRHRKLSAGEEVIALEADACVFMLTVKGMQWVAQKEGEKFIFKVLDAQRQPLPTPEIVAREDCGNNSPHIRYPKTAVAENPPVIPPSRSYTPLTCPEGTEPSERPGICIERVKAEIINVCPTNISWDNESDFWDDRVFDQGWQKLGSLVGSLGLSKGRGKSWKGAALDGFKGVGLQAGQQLFNADESVTYLTISEWGINRAKIKKGKPADLGRGVTVEWQGSHAVLFVENNGKKFRCDGQGLKKASNLGIWTGGKSKSPTITQGPKTQPKPPVQPTQNSTGVGGGTRPTRPTIGNPLTNRTQTNQTPTNSSVMVNGRRVKTQIM